MKIIIIPFIYLCLNFVMVAQTSVGNVEINKYARLEIVADNKGILIPRVGLLSTTSPNPIAANMSVLTTSLLVFNIQKINDVDVGYYYWLDNKWNKWTVEADIEKLIDIYGKSWSMSGNVANNTYFIGTTNAAPFNIKTNNIERINIGSDGKIEFKNPVVATAESYITVKGLKEMAGIYFLGVDSKGNLYKQTPDKESRQFMSVSLELQNANGDWINDFDTRINSTDYSVVIVGYSYSDPVALSYDNVPKTNVKVFVSGGTWRLSLDYADSSSYDAAGNQKNGTWFVNLLIIKNKQLNTITKKTYNLGGSSVGSALTPIID